MNYLMVVEQLKNITIMVIYNLKEIIYMEEDMEKGKNMMKVNYWYMMVNNYMEKEKEKEKNTL